MVRELRVVLLVDVRRDVEREVHGEEELELEVVDLGRRDTADLHAPHRNEEAVSRPPDSAGAASGRTFA